MKVTQVFNQERKKLNSGSGSFKEFFERNIHFGIFRPDLCNRQKSPVLWFGAETRRSRFLPEVGYDMIITDQYVDMLFNSLQL